MKKIALCTGLVVAVGLFFLHGEKVIKVTPFVNKIPEGKPYSGTFLEKEGMEFEWTLLHDLPKKREYLKRIASYFEIVKTKKIILNNLTPPFSKARLRRIPKEKMVLILWEPPSVFLHQYQEEVLDLFGTVLTWNDELVDGKKFFKVHYPARKAMEKELPPFKDKKLLCMIATNLKFNDIKEELYSKRREAVTFFETKPKGTFDLYGKGWDTCSYAKGWIESKHETLKEYKFNFCFENCHIPGYITEKIFDAFAAGVVPIYLGATNIEEYIPTDCFIDFRQFENFEEMLSFIQGMTKEEYAGYIERIRAFLNGPQSEPFSREAFLKTLEAVLYPL